MISRINIRYPFFSLLLGACLFSCQFSSQQKGNAQEDGPSLGTIHLSFQGNEEAQKEVNKGLLLLHSFEYQDARTHFLLAQEADPECLMAVWGEVMTYNQPIWQEQDYKKGQAGLEKLGASQEERISKASSELEKGFLESVEILYGDGNKIARDKAYAAYYEDFHNEFPEEEEVAVFYALALLGSVPYISDMEVFQKGASIAAEVMEKNPTHPGAVHYFIHANDEPSYAEQARKAADLYAQVAPGAAHALHMPSHIYLSLGLWDEVVASNEESYQASVDRKERKELEVDALGFHSFHWLQYGYLQQGHPEKASKMLEEMAGYTKEISSPYLRTHQIYLKTSYLAESKDWDHPLVALETDHTKLNIAIRHRDHYIHALRFLEKERLDSVDSLLDIMVRYREEAEKSIRIDAGMALCSSGGATREEATPYSINMAQVMEWELQALKALHLNDKQKAEKYFVKATELENEVGSFAGPPMIVQPSHELYGAFLMEEERWEEAKSYFQQALKLAPNRKISREALESLEGKNKALALVGS